VTSRAAVRWWALAEGTSPGAVLKRSRGYPRLMPRGGPRAGAGRPPTNLRRVIATREAPDGSVVEVTIIDRVEETLRQGAMVKDAAARVGVAVETLRRWQATGVRVRAALGERDADGNPKHDTADLSAHERNCVELANRMDAAEADTRTALLALTQQLARGGRQRVETIVKVNAAGQELERVTKTSTTEPDIRAIQWMLSHRWRDDFGSRVEVTGADGGPVLVDAEPIADRLRADLAEVRANRAASSRDVIEEQLAAAKGNGHSVNGNGHH
jgi:transposase-like protein